MPALDLLDRKGNHVSLRGELPAVVLVTDGCACAKLIADTVAAARPEIAVVVIGRVRRDQAAPRPVI